MGLAMTAYMAVNNKAKVVLFTRKRINSLRLNTVEQNKIETTDNFCTSDDPGKAFNDADIIFVTYPAFLRKSFIEQIQEHIKEGTFVGFVPGYGGAEYSCGELLRRGVYIFGLQRVPYVARATEDEDGKIAGILSSKKELFVGAIPKAKTAVIADIINELLDIPAHPLREYLSITLAPSNPLLHIAGLYNVFRDYREGDIITRPLKFYEEWNDETSELLFLYDSELQEICSKLSPIDMREVVPLPVYYESPTPERMTLKLKSIESFKAVMVPLIKIENGYLPDLKSRMFIEDYPYGVCVIKDFARLLDIKTPTIDMLLSFYENLSGHKYFNDDNTYTDEIKNTGVPGINGLKSKEDIINFYHQ